MSIKAKEVSSKDTYTQIDLTLLQPLHVYVVDHVRHLVECAVSGVTSLW